jgi:hypothetical protein
MRLKWKTGLLKKRLLFTAKPIPKPLKVLPQQVKDTKALGGKTREVI